MKKKLTDIASCLITIVLILCVIQYLGFVLRPTNTDSAVEAINAFHSMPENSIEVIGFGSSHMWRGMDPRVMYREYGIGAYNYGCNWQKVNTTSLFLQDALRTQNPKVVLIEGFYLSDFLWNVDMDGEIYYTRAIDEFEGKHRFLDQCFDGDKERYWERYLSYYVPLTVFHDNWVNLSSKSFRPIPDGENFLKTMGYFDSDLVTPVTLPAPETLPQSEFQPAILYELELMVQLCKDRNIDVIFYTAPYYSEEWPYAYSEATEKFAQEHDCVFFDMFKLMDEVGIDGATDFSDAGHLNNSGSEKVARYLGKYISENYAVTDMRTVSGNPWETYIVE